MFASRSSTALWLRSCWPGGWGVGSSHDASRSQGLLRDDPNQPQRNRHEYELAGSGLAVGQVPFRQRHDLSAVLARHHGGDQIDTGNSNQASSGRDQFSTNPNCKFVTPMIASGKVYVGTATSAAVFGLLNP